VAEVFRKPLFSVGDAAAYLGVSASTVRRRIAAGALRAHRWGRRWIMWRADLDRYRAQATSPRALPPLRLHRSMM
jgi:excisionase family DNA binding protein